MSLELTDAERKRWNIYSRTGKGGHRGIENEKFHLKHLKISLIFKKIVRIGHRRELSSGSLNSVKKFSDMSMDFYPCVFPGWDMRKVLPCQAQLLLLLRWIMFTWRNDHFSININDVFLNVFSFSYFKQHMDRCSENRMNVLNCNFTSFCRSHNLNFVKVKWREFSKTNWQRYINHKQYFSTFSTQIVIVLKAGVYENGS